jgi:acetolactate synthase-1/2/3 large subunit
MDALPDFVKLAEAYGHVGIARREARRRRRRAARGLRQKDRLVFLDVITDQTENVFRWCPAARASRR